MFAESLLNYLFAHPVCGGQGGETVTQRLPGQAFYPIRRGSLPQIV